VKEAWTHVTRLLVHSSHAYLCIIHGHIHIPRDYDCDDANLRKRSFICQCATSAVSHSHQKLIRLYHADPRHFKFSSRGSMSVLLFREQLLILFCLRVGAKEHPSNHEGRGPRYLILVYVMSVSKTSLSPQLGLHSFERRGTEPNKYP
jgi:hypothetical protein